MQQEFNSYCLLTILTRLYQWHLSFPLLLYVPSFLPRHGSLNIPFTLLSLTRIFFQLCHLYTLLKLVETYTLINQYTYNHPSTSQSRSPWVVIPYIQLKTFHKISRHGSSRFSLWMSGVGTFSKGHPDGAASRLKCMAETRGTKCSRERKFPKIYSDAFSLPSRKWKIFFIYGTS